MEKRLRRGPLNGNWKGEKKLTMEGYVYLNIYPEDFFFPMATQEGRILEHRLVVAKYLGRCLQSWEKVHHKNGDKTDNRIENLELGTQSDHLSGHTNGYRAGYRKGLHDGQDERIKALEARIALLEAELALHQVSSNRMTSTTK